MLIKQEQVTLIHPDLVNIHLDPKNLNHQELVTINPDQLTHIDQEQVNLIHL